MGKKKVKINNKPTINIDAYDSGAEFDTSKLTWEGVIDLRNESAHILLSQQLLLTELVKLHEKDIEQDSELNDAVTGLMNSYMDIANAIAKLTNTHTTTNKDGSGVVYRTGNISKDNIDEQMDFIKICSGYIAEQEKIGHLAATAYLDIFVRLKTPTDNVVELATNYKDWLIDVQKEVDNVSEKKEN